VSDYPPYMAGDTFVFNGSRWASLDGVRPSMGAAGGPRPHEREPAIGDMVVWDGSRWIASRPEAKVLTGDTTGPAIVGWGPTIVGERAAVPPAPRVRPFSLRCPSCIAPLQPETMHGAISKCSYCGVPLVWEAVVPLTRDDANFRQVSSPDNEAEDEPHIIGFGPVETCCMSSFVVTENVQVSMVPSRLFVPPKIADHFSIEDIRVGKDSQRTSPSLIAASAFSAGRGAPIACEPAFPGVHVTIVARNKTAQNHTFEAVIRGKRYEPKYDRVSAARSLGDDKLARSILGASILNRYSEEA